MSNVILDDVSGKTFEFDDTVPVSKIKASLSDFNNGTITDPTKSFIGGIEANLKSATGVDITQPINAVKSAWSGAQTGLASMIAPAYNFVNKIPFIGEGAEYDQPSVAEQTAARKSSPLGYIAGNVGGVIGGAAGIGGLFGPAMAALGEVPELASIGAKLTEIIKAGGIAGKATEMGVGAAEQAAQFGAINASSSVNQQEQTYGDIDWHEVGKEALGGIEMGAAAGAVTKMFGKSLEDIIKQSSTPEMAVKAYTEQVAKNFLTQAGIGYAMTRAGGGTHEEGVFTGVLFGGMGLLHTHGEYQSVRDGVITDLYSAYGNLFKAEFPQAAEGVPEQYVHEAIRTKAQEILAKYQAKADELTAKVQSEAELPKDLQPAPSTGIDVNVTPEMKPVIEKAGLTRDIFEPGTAANPTDKWSAQIRVKGWANDEKLFDTEAEARAWAESHTGELSQEQAGKNAQTIKDAYDRHGFVAHPDTIEGESRLISDTEIKPIMEIVASSSEMTKDLIKGVVEEASGVKETKQNNIVENKSSIRKVTIDDLHKSGDLIPDEKIEAANKIVDGINKMQDDLGVGLIRGDEYIAKGQKPLNSAFRSQESQQKLREAKNEDGSNKYKTVEHSAHEDMNAVDIPTTSLKLDKQTVAEAAHRAGFLVEDIKNTPDWVHIELPSETSTLEKEGLLMSFGEKNKIADFGEKIGRKEAVKAITDKVTSGELTEEQANKELEQYGVKLGDIPDPLNEKARKRMNDLAGKANEQFQRDGSHVVMQDKTSGKWFVYKLVAGGKLGEVRKVGKRFETEQAAKDAVPRKTAETKAGEVKEPVGKIKTSSKSVRDNTQSVTVKNGKVTVVNNSGRNKLGSFTFDIKKWEELEKSFGNPNFNKREFIRQLNAEAFPDNYSGEKAGDPLIARIEDAQISAINDAFKKYKEAQGFGANNTVFTKEMKDAAENKHGGLNESGQVSTDILTTPANIAREIIHVLSPKTFVDSKALDEIYKAKGGKDKMEFELEAGMKTFRDMFDRQSNEENTAFIDRIKTGEKQPTPELQGIADMMRQVEDAYYKEVQKLKPSASYLENHYRVLWKVVPGSPEARGFQGLFRRPLQGTKGFLKQHTLADMSEGLAKGGEPYSYNPMVMWQHSMMDMQSFITANKMFNAMKQMKMVQFVKFGESAPDGFTKINDGIARKYFPTDAGMVDAGQYYAEEGVGRVLNNYLSPDHVRNSAIGSTLLKFKNFTTSLELSLSTFHAMYESGAAMATKIGLGLQKIANKGDLIDGMKDIATFPVAPGQFTAQGGRAIKYVADPKEFIKTLEGQDFIKQFPDAEALVNDAFTGGMKFAIHQDYKTNSMRALIDGVKNKEPWAITMNALPGLNEAVMSPMFEYFIPRLKLGSFLNEMQNAVQVNQGRLDKGQITRPELARQVVDSIENRFGEMNFDNLFWDRSFKSAMQIVIRSVTWKVGALKNMAVAVPEQMAEIAKAAQNGDRPQLKSNFAYLLGVGTLIAVASNIIQRSAINEDPKDFKDLIAPRYNADGDRIMLNTHLKDWIHMLHNPGQFATSSAAGYIGKFVDLMNNKDFYGTEIVHADDAPAKKAWEATKFLFPTPFSLSQYQRVSQLDAPDALKLSTVLGATQPAPGYVSKTAAENKASEIMASHQSVGSRTKEAFDKTQLKNKLRLDYETNHNQSVINQSVNSGDITRKDAHQIIKDASKSKIERMTTHMTADEVAHVIEKSNDDELKELMPIFEKKVRTKMDSSSDADRKKLKELRDNVVNKYGGGR